MKPFIVSHDVAASVEDVFNFVANPEEFAKCNPDVLGIEFHTPMKSGVGTEFSESRQMGKRVHVTRLEVTEFVLNQKIRMVNNDGQAIWDTTYTVKPSERGTKLDVVMEVIPQKFMFKIMFPLFRGMTEKGFAKNFQLAKEYLEE